MATIFGIEEQNAQGFTDEEIFCLPRLSDGKLDLHSTVSPIKNEDIVFVKHFTPPAGLKISAIGVVRSEFPIKNKSAFCLQVEWVWQGERIIENFDENMLMDGSTLYEEHDISVIREIIDLLPKKFQLQPEW